MPAAPYFGVPLAPLAPRVRTPGCHSVMGIHRPGRELENCLGLLRPGDVSRCREVGRRRLGRASSATWPPAEGVLSSRCPREDGPSHQIRHTGRGLWFSEIVAGMAKSLRPGKGARALRCRPLVAWGAGPTTCDVVAAVTLPAGGDTHSPRPPGSLMQGASNSGFVAVRLVEGVEGDGLYAEAADPPNSASASQTEPSSSTRRTATGSPAGTPVVSSWATAPVGEDSDGAAFAS